MLFRSGLVKETPTPTTKQPEKSIAKAETSIEKTGEKTTEKPIEKTIDKPQEKPVPTTTPASSVIPKQDVAVKTTPIVPVTSPVVVQPKEPEVPLFKNLFAYKANEPHYVAIYILSGTIDYAKTKSLLDEYNAKNYSVMNLKITLEKVDKQQVIIIGSMTDANVAKSYLLRMVKEKTLFEGLKNANYRNLLGSQKNLNILMQQNALNVYFEFMTEYYLK